MSSIGFDKHPFEIYYSDEETNLDTAGALLYRLRNVSLWSHRPDYDFLVYPYSILHTPSETPVSEET